MDKLYTCISEELKKKLSLNFLLSEESESECHIYIREIEKSQLVLFIILVHLRVSYLINIYQDILMM
jgi:hypothetical protein